MTAQWNPTRDAPPPLAPAPRLAPRLLGGAGLALMPILAACERAAPPPDQSRAGLPIQAQVDSLAARIAANVAPLQLVVSIDHARLAAAAGVSMPPSLVTVYSDPATNSALIRDNPLTALDLPHRILAYAEPGATVASVAYADAEFFRQRHGVTSSALLDGYATSLALALDSVPVQQRLPVTVEGLDHNYGIIELMSDYTHDETVRRLKETIGAQSDTKWFAEVDFRADAAALGIEIPPSTLLLFGGPAPGGQAMAEFPRLGLDAFCQKLLVYQDGATVRVAFNDIAALAWLHYGRVIPIHEGLNQRLTQTFRAAISATGT